MNGNLEIPQKFVVPSGDSDWPKETWGLKLGGVLHNIRHNGSFADRHEELIEVGVNFDYSKVSNRFFTLIILFYSNSFFHFFLILLFFLLILCLLCLFQSLL